MGSPFVVRLLAGQRRLAIPEPILRLGDADRHTNAEEIPQMERDRVRLLSVGIKGSFGGRMMCIAPFMDWIYSAVSNPRSTVQPAIHRAYPDARYHVSAKYRRSIDRLESHDSSVRRVFQDLYSDARHQSVTHKVLQQFRGILWNSIQSQRLADRRLVDRRARRAGAVTAPRYRVAEGAGRRISQSHPDPLLQLVGDSVLEAVCLHVGINQVQAQQADVFVPSVRPAGCLLW